MLKKYLIKHLGTNSYYLSNGMFGPPIYGVQVYHTYSEAEAAVQMMISIEIYQIVDVYIHPNLMGG